VSDRELSAVFRELVGREPIFHRPELGTTRADFEAMTAPSFWEVGASGRCYEREVVLDELERRFAGGTPPDEDLRTSDFRIQQLAADTFLLTYLLAQGTRLSRRATIWRHDGSQWTIVYHQGTLVSGA
jgi:hypothetical protein